MTEEERAYRASRDPAHLVEVDAAGRSHLHLAAMSGKAAVCRIYIAAGCDPSTHDNSGRTAAELAKAAGYAALARSLEALPARPAATSTPKQAGSRPELLDAAEQRGLVSGNQQVIAAIISNGRLRCRNPKGDTPLHLAAAGGHLTACNALFEAGADPGARNDAKQTPAEMAAESGHQDLARLLSGQEPEATAPSRSSPPPAALQPEVTELQPFADAGFDLIDFDALEEPAAYHARQQIGTVSAIFTAISPRSGMRSGGAEENDDWELPTSLAKAGAAGSSQFQAGRPPDLDDAADFSHSSASRRSRRPRKLRDTTFALSADLAETWAAEALASGMVNEQAIRDLVSACRGNPSWADLETNVGKVLAAAGIHVIREAGDFRPFPDASLDLVDVAVLSEAIVAACTRDAVVPGSGPFILDRATEERILREIANARRDLLDGILDTPGVLAEVVRRGELVLAGELAPDEFTELDIDPDADDGDDDDFPGNIEILRNAVEEGVKSGGRARRVAIQALEELEIRQDCLVGLAASQGEVAEGTIRRLMSICDRAAEELVLRHLSFMRRETAKMAKADEDAEELFQEAYFGLRRASERFDPERGVRFYLYALLWIRQRISRWRADQGSLIRVPVHRVQLNAKITTHAEEFERSHLRSATDLELAAATGFEAATIRSLQFALSDPVPFHQVEGAIASRAEGQDEIFSRAQLASVISRELNDLPARAEAVIRMRFGIGLTSDMTLEEVGKIYGVTRERIRQIEAKSLQTLAHPSRRRVWRGLL
ncbi:MULTISPECIES: sigma-70 family RNA polymerase sigma factor [Sphingomonas]|uniref:Sigma-70 family RNA polymerase sigma factor n=1 Tax=Sphingomonas molluscorum TaxID=418184 RepID=A0ABU8Q7E0_9SPHN|nr:sigma-70 family RNA polymerase sigma factor [Sphingomonas sp. JUb134]MBM7407007.1 RNA polymerase primary sigma factor [Sphingomonas sp. JUb134]